MQLSGIGVSTTSLYREVVLTPIPDVSDLARKGL
jgi:hypothetical protein